MSAAALVPMISHDRNQGSGRKAEVNRVVNIGGVAPAGHPGNYWANGLLLD